MATAKVTKKERVQRAFKDGAQLTHAALRRKSGLTSDQAVSAVISQLNAKAISEGRGQVYRGLRDAKGVFKYYWAG